MSVLLMQNFLAKVMYDNIIFIRKKLIVQLPNFQTLLSKWIWLQFSKWANLVSLSEFTALNFEIKHPHGNTKRTFWNELYHLVKSKNLKVHFTKYFQIELKVSIHA